MLRRETYLLLKDIFPQGTVDLIGCISEADCQYILKHNPEINPKKVEICLNCIEVKDFTISEQEKIALRKKYCIPLDKTVFVYGRNLGKPQEIPFLLESLKTQLGNEKDYFLIAGDGTKYNTIATFLRSLNQAI